jgi:hypothetical protein
MAKNRKRRMVVKNPPHQVMKHSNGPKGINWTKVAVITIGVLITLSMILSLFIFPGSF